MFPSFPCSKEESCDLILVKVKKAEVMYIDTEGWE